MRKLIDRISLVALCLLSIVLASALLVKNGRKLNPVAVVHAQTNSTTPTKTVVVNKTQRLDSVEVLEVLEGSSQITPVDPTADDMRWLEPGLAPVANAPQIHAAYKFQAGGSWLHDLTLVLRNRTSKNIVRVEFDVSFPETAASGPMIWPRVTFGQWPANVAFYGNGQPMPASGITNVVAPGQAMGFNFVNYEPYLEAAVAHRQPFSTVSICFFHLGVSFADGMIWTEAGGYAQPNSQFPGRYLPPDRAYFPGPLTGSPGE